jgi:hypothetical protein
MTDEEDKIYLDIINEIGKDVYDFFNMSDREDLIMVYKMKENKIYSYIYNEFKNDLNAKSKQILETQYKEAKESKMIVLFIRDEMRKKFKSFVI